MKTKFDHRQRGSTLAVVISTMAILMVIVAVAVYYTTQVSHNTQRTTTLQSALAAGDSAIEVLFNNWRSSCRTSPTAVYTTNNFSAIPTPSPFPNMPTSNFVKRGTSYDPASDEYDSTYTISNYKVVGVNAEYGALASAAATPEAQLGQVNTNVGSGANPSPPPTTSATYNYIASADVTLNASFGSSTQRAVVAKVRRVFSKQQLSPWNFAIFYVDPLEIDPGALFTVTGWVHTNSDLYTGHWLLTFADKVTYGGDWFESTSANLMAGFMPGDQDHLAGDSQNGSPTYVAGLPPARDQALQPFGLDSTSIFSTTDSNPNNDSYAELIQPPVSGYTDPLSGERYWDQADVIIQVSDNSSSSMKGGLRGPSGYTGANGSDFINLYTVNSSTGATTALTSGPLYNLFATTGAITTNQTIQDNREGAQIRLASLDISKLITGSATNPSYAQPASGFSSKPIIYIYDSSSTSTSRRGIRIVNGSSIPSAGLTIASQNPVYIQGDFNTGGTGTAVPSNNPSNLNSDGTYPNPNSPPNPMVSGYTRAPTSVLADAVNLLSSAWSDGNSGTVPAAAPTTYNVAIVSGNVPTNTYGDGAYSGGAENFPRFLEDWTNKTITYYGSMVELYQSKQSVGEWGKANVYVPPTREWYFDTNFKMNPPPGSLMVYSYVKGRWYVL
jgi:hypothetical protein